jgi:2-oxoglutarate dehydrogenase E2 component (dihydrolipoamide succinyltransferase)
VGGVFAIIETQGDSVSSATPTPQPVEVASPAPVIPVAEKAQEREHTPEMKEHIETGSAIGQRFYSPLVRSIAQQENIPFTELDRIPGTGKDDRLTKQDILNYLRDRASGPTPAIPAPSVQEPLRTAAPMVAPAEPQQVIPGSDHIVEMDRIRQLIANHMIKSVQTSPHVTSFMEADMTRIVLWREKNKEVFQKREKEKLTYTPVIIEAIAKAVRDFPMVNVSVDGSKIIVHRNVNIGMAVALPNFNLIVPVVRNASEKNLLGIVKSVNDLAERARIGKLVPDEISGGTISLTNLGSFGTLMGTPIINQPQTAIVATGAIKKRPVVVETPEGDTIAIRHIMILSVTYDHRVIDGALGGQFLSRIVQYLEQFDINQPV